MAREDRLELALRMIRDLAIGPDDMRRIATDAIRDEPQSKQKDPPP